MKEQTMKKMIWSLAIALCSLLALPLTAYANSGLSLYITAQNDSINQISQNYAIDCELLAAINNLDADTLLPAGMAIHIPEEPRLAIIVEKGDTLWSLAKNCGMTVEEIAALNALDNLDRLAIGQKLLVPLMEENNAYSDNMAVTDLVHPVLASRQSSLGYEWPVIGIITSRYGQRSRGWHSGLDIAADVGMEIQAIAAGKVIEADWKNNAYGYTVMTEHQANQVSLYSHASKILVNPGTMCAKASKSMKSVKPEMQPGLISTWKSVSMAPASTR